MIIRTTYRPSVIGLATLAGLCAALPARASLITNGDFETGTLSSWMSTGNVGIAALPYFGLNEPTYGQYSAAFNGGDSVPNGVLYQIISTVAGTSYTVVFNYVDNAYAYEYSQLITASAQTGEGQILSSQSYTSSVPTQPYSLDFTATSSTTTINFADNPGNYTGSQDGILDNVSVNIATAVPEPSSLALLVFGVAGIVTMHRRAFKAQ